MSGTLPSISGTTIPFKEVPPQYQLPGDYTEIQPAYGNQGVLPWPAKVLAIAQMLATGTAQPLTPMQITRPSDATAYFGAGSQAEGMAFAFIAANPYTPLFVMGVVDAPSATKATGTYTISGTWTVGWTFVPEIAGVRIPVGVLPTDTPTLVASNAATAINAVPSLPVTAAAALGVLTITAKNGGVAGNDIDLWLNPAPGDVLGAGALCAVVRMTGGATNPTIGAAITAITGEWFTGITCAWQDAANLSALETELDLRFGAMETLDALSFTVLTGTFAQQQAAKATINSRFIYGLCLTNPQSPPWALAASLAGVAAFRLTADPGRQLGDLALPGMLGSRPADRLITEEKELALEGGLCPVHVLSDGTVVLTRVVSMYLTNNAGVPDPAWHDVMTAAVMSRIRYDWDAYRKLVYPSNKLAPDGSVAAEYDTTIATPGRLKGSWAARSLLYEKMGWITGAAANAKQSVFVPDPNDPNRVNSSRPVTIIGNLMIDATVLQFQL